MNFRPTIVFDLDGTLADTVDDLLEALNRTLARCGLPAFAKADFERLSGGGGLRTMLAYAFKARGIPLTVEQHQALFADTVKDYDLNIAVRSRLYPGALAALEHFKSANWLCAVCTNKPIAQSTKLLRELKLDNYFAAVTGGDSFPYRKPNPQHLVDTIELAGGSLLCAVMIGDSETDIRAAQNASVPVVAVDFGYSEHPVSTYGPDAVVSHYHQVFTEARKLIRRG